MFTITIQNHHKESKEFALDSYEFKDAEELFESYAFEHLVGKDKDWKVTKQDCDIPSNEFDFIGKQPSEDELDQAIEMAWEWDDLNEEQQIVVSALLEDRYTTFMEALDDVRRQEYVFYNREQVKDVARERFLEGFYFPELSYQQLCSLSDYIDFEKMFRDYEEAYRDWLTPDNNTICAVKRCCIEKLN